MPVSGASTRSAVLAVVGRAPAVGLETAFATGPAAGPSAQHGEVTWDCRLTAR